MKDIRIRDLDTGQILVRHGFTAEELLKSREPSKNGKRGRKRYVPEGSEPEGWKPPENIRHESPRSDRLIEGTGDAAGTEIVAQDEDDENLIETEEDDEEEQDNGENERPQKRRQKRRS